MHLFLFYIAGVGVTNAVWLSNDQLLITTNVPNSYTDAIGHFSFGYSNNRGFEFFADPKYVNNFYCDDDPYHDSRVNPYTSVWTYDGSVKPPIGENVGIWVAIYWDCSESGDCCHTNVYYPSVASANTCG